MFRVSSSIAVFLVVVLVASRASADDVAYDFFLRQIGGLVEPRGVAFGADGNLYITESGRHAVRVVDCKGRAIREWGIRGDVGDLRHPGGIACAPDGSIFVADTGNTRIAVFDASGHLLRQWGERGPGPGQFAEPIAIALNHGYVYVADAGNHRIQIYRPDGAHVRDIGRFGTRRGEFRRPCGVAIDENGALYVADTYNHRIQKITADGAPLLAWGARGYFPSLLAAPVGITVRDGLVYVADSMNHRIQVFGANGERKTEWGLHVFVPREGAGRLHYPEQIAISPDGAHAVVAEPLEDRLQVFRHRTRQDPPPEAWRDPEPSPHYGERFAVAGDLLAIPEPETARIQVYDRTRPVPVLITHFGSPGSGAAKFSSPDGVAIDDSARGRERIFVTDPIAQRLFIFGLDRDAERLAFDLRLSRFVLSIDFPAWAENQGGLKLEWPIEPTAVAYGGDDRLLILDRRNCLVLELDTRGRLCAEFGGFDPEAGFCAPVDIALSPDQDEIAVLENSGRVSIHRRGGRPVSRWRPSGRFETSRASGIVWSRDGVLRLVDAGGHRVISRSAMLGSNTSAEQFGAPGLAAGEFFKPRSIAEDPDGKLIVLDFGNHRAQVFTRSWDFLRAFGTRAYVAPTRTAEMAVASRPSSQFIPGAGHGATVPTEKSPPPPASMPAVFETLSNAGTYRVRIEPQAPPIQIGELFDLRISVLEGTPPHGTAQGVIIAVDADMPEHQHGMTTESQVTLRDDHDFDARGLNFHMPGYWEIYVDISRGGLTERAQVAVTLER